MNVRPALLVGGLVLLLLAGAMGLYVWLPPRQTGSVEVPADDASPEEVVRAYTEAITAHDCDTARVLSTDGFDDTATSWCRTVSEIDQLDTEAPSSELPEWSGHAPDEQVVRVGVEFDLEWRPWRGDVSLPGGDTTWGYLLVRSSDTAPWRIFDHGNG
ncbi:MAG: DUF4829 domain-containing protein [Nocardioides sp.]|uniref:DUF4829 domain-containing protein n=1 Tax=Nocardioides sp. TaxID=35761 RepID=UPI003F0DB286